MTEPTFEHDREQLALFFHARDSQAFGTAPWDEIDPIGREQYLGDAEAAMKALQALGWRSLPCDGGCDYNTGPEETCSAHGRPVAEVWEIAQGFARERDAARAALERGGRA